MSPKMPLLMLARVPFHAQCRHLVGLASGLPGLEEFVCSQMLQASIISLVQVSKWSSTFVWPSWSSVVVVKRGRESG